MDIQQSEWDAVSHERETPGANPPASESLPDNSPKQLEEAVPAKPAEDPYAGLHPDVQAKLKQFDSLAATVPSLVNELREAKGRIGALQSGWDKLQQRAAEAPSSKQIADATKDPEKWASLKSDFPEWGEGISEYVEARLGQLAGSGLSAEQIEQMVAERAGSATAQIEKTFNERLVAMKHPKWKDEVKTPDFNTWFSAQDATTQALATSVDPMDAIALMDGYAAHKAKPVAQVRTTRQQRLEQAVTTTKPGQTPVTKSFDEMSPQEQWAYLAERRDKA
jgi:hypothetical protein